MSVIWNYEPNTMNDHVFCRSCSGLRDTPYFIAYDNEDSILCRRCVGVLARLYAMVLAREE
jgi:hypothetical protein